MFRDNYQPDLHFFRNFRMASIMGYGGTGSPAALRVSAFARTSTPSAYSGISISTDVARLCWLESVAASSGGGGETEDICGLEPELMDIEIDVGKGFVEGIGQLGKRREKTSGLKMTDDF